MKVHFRIYLIVWIIGSSQIVWNCVWPFKFHLLWKVLASQMTEMWSMRLFVTCDQNGFRPWRGTREQILALRLVIKEVVNFQLPCAISFIDFSKAFDCIFRSHLPDILTSYGFPKKIVKAIMSLYINTKAKIMTPWRYNLRIPYQPWNSPGQCSCASHFYHRPLPLLRPGFHTKTGNRATWWA